MAAVCASIVVAVLAAGCDGQNAFEVPLPTGAELTLDAPQFSINDGTIDTLNVRIVDSNGAPLDVDIEWQSVDPSIVSITGNGVISGLRPGQTTIRAMAGDLTASSVVTVRKVPARLEYVAGTGQVGAPNSKLPGDVTVRLLDRHGDPVASNAVEFRVVDGNGVTTPSLTSTDAQGIAHTSWILGSNGTQELAAVAIPPVYVEAIQEPVVSFTAAVVTTPPPTEPDPEPEPEPEPPALAIGTVTANGGTGQISLSAPAATGGTAPYTYQWHGGTSDPGSNPSSGSAIAGLTSRTGTHTGLNAGTRYYYRLVVRDQAGRRVVSAVATAVTTAPPPPPALEIGAVSATAGNAQIALSAPAATGGTPSYHYQWHGGTSDPGTNPGSGSALAGFTSRSATHSGLTNGTRYYYRLVVTDDAGGRAVSSVVSATPTAPSAGTSLYPNMPAGMTIIGNNDGSVRDANGNAFGIPGFSRWYTDSNRNPNAITVVDDPSNPTGSGKAIRFRYDPAAQYLSGQAEAPNLPGGPWRSFYVAFYQKHEAGWTRGHKNFYFGPAGSATRFWLEWQAPGTTRVVPQGELPVIDAPGNAREVDSWHRVEMLVTGESSSGAGNGSVRVWVDGVLVGQNSNVRWGTTGFGGMEWYAVINDIPSVQYQRIGGLIVAGSK